MNRRDMILALLALGAAGGPLAAEAQQSKDKTAHIGILVTVDLPRFRRHGG